MMPLLSGLLLALAFPKFGWWWLAFFALVPFFWSLNRARDIRQALASGALFGLTFFAVNLYWVTSLARFVGWWAWLAWCSLAVFQACFIILFAFLSVAATFRSPSNGGLKTASTFLFALLWVFVEWLRSLGPFGTTAGDVGYTQASCLPLIQIASFTTVYGVSFLVVFFNAALADMIGKPATKRRGFLFIFALLLIAGSYVYGIRITHYALRVTLPRLAIIQPNIDQKDKMNYALVESTFKVHEELTRQAAKERPEIIIWPETAIFSYVLQNQALFSRLKKLARDCRAYLIVGTPYYDEHGKIFNSIVAISPSGEVAGRYNKQHLVPFGEYLPFKPLLYPWLKNTGYFSQDFTADQQPQMLRAGKYKIAAAICFESTMPDAIKARAAGADFILVVTNDAWFGDSAAPYVHLQNGIFRAVENRQYFIQAANSGISAVIDPDGRIVEQTRVNERKVLSVSAK
jgi:apolipoprotein N-acyltransferase